MTFEALTKKLSPVIKRIVYKVNVGFTYFNEEDLYQEALIHLWSDFNAGKLENKTDSYILQGCYFYLKNYIRVSRPKARTISIDFIIGDDGESVKETLFLKDKHCEDYFDSLNSKFLADTLHNNGFTNREKKILRFYSEGLTTRQIGTRLGISHVRVVKLTEIIRQKSQKYIDK